MRFLSQVDVKCAPNCLSPWSDQQLHRCMWCEHFCCYWKLNTSNDNLIILSTLLLSFACIRVQKRLNTHKHECSAAVACVWDQFLGSPLRCTSTSSHTHYGQFVFFPSLFDCAGHFEMPSVEDLDLTFNKVKKKKVH